MNSASTNTAREPAVTVSSRKVPLTTSTVTAATAKAPQTLDYHASTEEEIFQGQPIHLFREKQPHQLWHHHTEPSPLGHFPSVQGRKKYSPRMQRFSVEHSTEQHWKCSPDSEHRFNGPFGHIRRKLDYTYHCHYRKERQWLHDSIIEEFLLQEEDDDDFRVANREGDQWLILTVGARGAGKHHTMRRLVKTGRLPFRSFVFVDPDEIRHFLPEYDSYVENAPDMLDALTQKECGFIAETLTLAALQAGRNVVLDGCMKDASWHAKYVQRLQAENEFLRVAVFHITASNPSTILQRVEKRSALTGRSIPKEDTEECLRCIIPRSLEAVKPYVNYFCVMKNDDGVDLEVLDDTWSHFSTTFADASCPFRDKKTRRLTHLVSLENLDKIDVDSATTDPTTFEIDEEAAVVSDDAGAGTSASLRKSVTRRRFSVTQSTEEIYKADNMKFYGQFAHIRETLDYKYHSNFTFERQRFQDAVIREFLDAAVITDRNGAQGTTPTEPWIVFTAGAMGAGKSFTMRSLANHGHFPLVAFVNVDPDVIRRHLPEFHLYVNHNPELAGDLTRKEAGFIAEILTLAALEAGKNVLVDGSLRNSDWYQVYFDRLRKQFQGLRISIIHVTAPRDAVFQRAAARALTTGRIVPQKLLEAALDEVPRSMKVLGPLVDYHVELHNAPGAEDIELVTAGETWESFKSQWIQTIAWVPSMKRMLKTKRLREKLHHDTDF